MQPTDSTLTHRRGAASLVRRHSTRWFLGGSPRIPALVPGWREFEFLALRTCSNDRMGFAPLDAIAPGEAPDFGDQHATKARALPSVMNAQIIDQAVGRQHAVAVGGNAK